MKNKKTLAILLSMALLASATPVNTEAVAAPSVTKKMTLTVGRSQTIKVKGSLISSTKFKSALKSVATVSKKGKVTAKRKGTTKITVTVKYKKSASSAKTTTKKYTCKVVVKNAEKKQSDKKALTKLIKSKKAGSKISTNLDDEKQYTWDKNGRLIGIEWGGMNLKGKISFASLPNLKVIAISWNKITQIDVSKNTKLEKLYCQKNKLTALKLTNNKKLEVLSYTPEENIDISGLKNLKEIRLQSGDATTLDVSKNTKLEKISINNTQIIDLVIPAFPKLKEVSISNNEKMQSISMKGNTVLTNVAVYSNPKVTTIDMSGLTKIKRIGVSFSSMKSLSSLDVSGNTSLESLSCGDFALTKLNLKGLTKLKYLDCAENKLTSLDLSDLQSLETLNCYDNKISNLDASKCTALKSINCRYNKIETLNISGCAMLESLICADNKLTALDISNLPKLSYLVCGMNDIPELDITNNPLLQTGTVDAGMIPVKRNPGDVTVTPEPTATIPPLPALTPEPTATATMTPLPPEPTSTPEMKTSGDYQYWEFEDSIQIIKYTGSETDVVVPATVNDKTVVSAAQLAFQGLDCKTITFQEGFQAFSPETLAYCNSLEILNLPASMGSGIGGNVFGLGGTVVGCDRLKEVNVDEASPYLMSEDGVLYSKDKTALILYPAARTATSYEVPDTVTVMADDAFAGCHYLQSLKLSDSITCIGFWVFNEAYNLKEVNIPESCEWIGQFAFQNTSLESLHIPAKVRYILPWGINTGSIKTITVDADNEHFYAEDNVLFCEDDKSLVHFGIANESVSYRVPDGIEIIAAAAFNGQAGNPTVDCSTNLQEVILSETVKEIQYDAFSNMELMDLYVYNKDAVFAEYALMNVGPAVSPDDTDAPVFTIHGYEGSTAQEYAEVNGINFEVIEE